MHINRVSFLIVLLAILVQKTFAANEQPTVQVEWYSDETRNISFEEARSLNYQPLKNSLLKVGYSKDAEWLKIIVEKPSQDNYDGIIYFSKSTTDSVVFYYQQDGHWKTRFSGAHVADSIKKLTGSGLYFPITVEKNKEIYYARLVSSYSKQMSIQLLNYQGREQIENNEQLIRGLYVGALLIITLYNIFLGFSVRDKIYYHYSLANIATILASLVTRGALDNVLPDEYAHWTPILLATIHALSAIFMVNFSVRILDIKKYSKQGFYLLIGSAGFMVLNISIYNILLVWDPTAVYRFLPLGAVTFSTCSIIAGVMAARRGSPYARYYLVGWSFLFLGVILMALTYSGIIAKNLFVDNALLIGSVIEVLSLSFALADRYKFLQKERDKLEKDLRHKEGDLSMVINDNRLRHQFRKNVLEGIEDISKAENGELRSKLNSFIMEIKFQVETEEKQNFIQDNISEINSKFDEILKSNYPNLNASEREICQLIKLNLSVKEIARIRKISEGAVKASRHRIKKKMNLESLESLQKL